MQITREQIRRRDVISKNSMATIFPCVMLIVFLTSDVPVLLLICKKEALGKLLVECLSP